MNINKNKIVLIGAHPPTIGGISSHVKNLKKRLKQNSYDVKVIDVTNVQKNINREVDSGQTPLVFIGKIIGLSFRRNAIFHFHTSKRAYPFLLSILFLKLFRKKVILSIHHGKFNEWLKENTIRKSLYTVFFALSDYIVFMNSEDAAEFKELSSAKNSQILGISPFIVEDEKYYHSQYPISDKNVFKVTTMGLWRPYYLYEEVVEACKQVHEKYSIEIELDIVVGTISSDNEYREKIKKMVENESKNGLRLSIFEDKEGILDYFKERDVLVRASTVDSYGMCVAEALLVGTRAIATQVCSRPDNALLYKPHDIEKLVNHLYRVYEEKKNQKVKESMITKKDDSFYLIENTYRKLLS